MISMTYIGGKTPNCMNNHHETTQAKYEDAEICDWALKIIDKEVNN